MQLHKNPSILIYYLRGEISDMSMYINNFLLASNTMSTFNILKQSLVRKYDTKDLEEVKTIIGWQINCDTIVDIIKV